MPSPATPSNDPINPSMPTITSLTPPHSDDDDSPSLSISPHEASTTSPRPSPDQWSTFSVRSESTILPISPHPPLYPPQPFDCAVTFGSVRRPSTVLESPICTPPLIARLLDRTLTSNSYSAVRQLPRCRSLDTKAYTKPKRPVRTVANIQEDDLQLGLALVRGQKMKSETSLTAVTLLSQPSTTSSSRAPSRSRSFLSLRQERMLKPASKEFSLPGSTEMDDGTEDELATNSPADGGPDARKGSKPTLQSVSKALESVINTANAQLDQYLDEIRKKRVEPFYEQELRPCAIILNIVRSYVALFRSAGVDNRDAFDEWAANKEKAAIGNVTEDDLRHLTETEDRWDNFLYAIDKALHNFDQDLVVLDGFDAAKICLFDGHKNVPLKDQLSREPKDYAMLVYFGALHTPASKAMLREILVDQWEFLSNRRCHPILVTTADFEVAESWVQPVTEFTGLPVTILQDRGDMREKLNLPISLLQSSSMEVIHLLASDIVTRRGELPKVSDDPVTDLEDAHQSTAILFCNREGKVIFGHRMQTAIERLNLETMMNCLNQVKMKPPQPLALGEKEQQLLEDGLERLVFQDSFIKRRLSILRNKHRRKLAMKAPRSRACVIL